MPDRYHNDPGAKGLDGTSLEAADCIPRSVPRLRGIAMRGLDRRELTRLLPAPSSFTNSRNSGDGAVP